MIQQERIQELNSAPEQKGRYVLYWMQQAQRATWNHALEYAIREANDRSLPVVVGFGLTDGYPEANERHYAFMLEGLRDVDAALKTRGIRLLGRRGSPDTVALELGKDAALVVTDRGYLRIQKAWRESVAERARCRVVQVETDVVVPVESVSQKEEYAARTIRPKITGLLDDYLVPLDETPVAKPSVRMRLKGLDLKDADGLLGSLKVDRSVPRVARFRGGTTEAEALLDAFVGTRLRDYATKRNDPSLDVASHMSPYLHFGQISPLEVAMRIQATGEDDNVAAYLEELIVRRELSVNFVYHQPNYDTYEAVPEWARKTLMKHEDDPRDHLYDLEELESAETHDPYWNAAQREMMSTGKMHNYMRMYWGKKILEWSETPKAGFETALYLNNRYELDGRDPNSYAGVAWCFGKHDRPWQERPIFGTVRYMNSTGLKRKFDIEGYVKQVSELA